jgi:hypothetical protein
VEKKNLFEDELVLLVWLEVYDGYREEWVCFDLA